MAIDLRSTPGSLQEVPEFQLHQRRPSSRAALAEKKRMSRGATVLRPDPFRYGDPNPLGCHPYFSDKHPDYIHSVSRPLSFPEIGTGTGSVGLNFYSHEDLAAYRSQGCVPRLVRIDSLVALYDFFDSNTLTRALATAPRQAADKTPATTTVRHDTDASLEDFIRRHEVAYARRNEEEKRNLQNSNPVQVLSPSKGISRPTSGRSNIDVPIKHSPNSGLPSGWTTNHDYFIAYLDTHAPLTKEGTIANREWELPRYSIEQMLHLLKRRFATFRNITIPNWAIERRLEILDYRDNNYFKMPYGCYNLEVWGKGI